MKYLSKSSLVGVKYVREEKIIFCGSEVSRDNFYGMAERWLNISREEYYTGIWPGGYLRLIPTQHLGKIGRKLARGGVYTGGKEERGREGRRKPGVLASNHELILV